MSWRLIRLEHGPTREFPFGSASRAYLLRVPLESNGHIAADEHAEEPRRATVRRFWPSEPDLSGYIVRAQWQWHFVSRRAQASADEIGWFEDCALVLDRTIEITEAANGTIPFRVAAITRD